MPSFRDGGKFFQFLNFLFFLGGGGGEAILLLVTLSVFLFLFCFVFSENWGEELLWQCYDEIHDQ